MPTVERSLLIHARPELVWEAYTGLDGWLQWNPHMRELKTLTEGPLAVGTRVRITLRTRLSSEWEVTELVPGKSFTWISRVAPGLRMAFDHEVRPAKDATLAVLRIRSSGPMAILAAPVLALVYSRNLERALENLKALVDRRQR